MTACRVSLSVTNCHLLVIDILRALQMAVADIFGQVLNVHPGLIQSGPIWCRESSI